MKIDKLSLPFSEIAQIAAIEDSRVRQAMYDLMGRASSDPESICLDDYEGEAPIVQAFARRITDRVEASRRRAEAYKTRKKAAAEKAAKEADEKAAAEKAAAEKAAQEAAARPTGGPIPFRADSSRPNVIAMPAYRKFLWFRQNFSVFVDNVLAVIRSIQTDDLVFGALCEGFDELCGVISLVLNPMAARVGEVMKMPRASRPGSIEFYAAAPITQEELRRSSRIGVTPRFVDPKGF